MMTKILVPTDFSSDAYNALRFAANLFQDSSCTFYLLHCHKPEHKLKAIIDAGNRDSQGEEMTQESCQDALLEICNKIKGEVEKRELRLETVFREGNLVEGIDQLVKELDIDLVIMGNKGRTGAKEVLFGGNTVRTIQKMRSCPILMVPREYEFKPIKEMALATYFKRFFTADLIHPITTIASIFDATIRILQIDERRHLDRAQTANKTYLGQYLAEVKHSFHWMPYYAEKSKVIDQFVQDLGIQMLVMINYDHNILEKLIREPVIRELSSNLEIPLLVIPAND